MDSIEDAIMFKTISEKVAVGLLTAIAIALFWWGWSQMRSFRLGLPSGVIVMTERECSALGSMWEKYKNADGRFIVGAGKGSDANGAQKTFVAGETGGEYEVALTENELPPHKHSIRTGYGFAEHDGLAGAVGGGENETGIYQDFYNPPVGSLEGGGHGVLPSVISKSGNGAAHSNIPTFLAVNFCISS